VAALDVYLQELTTSAQSFDGTINKYVGDELISIWNAPIAQEDHALRGVLCALDMVSRMAWINRQLLAQGLAAIGFGIGVNTGEAVVGQMGSTLRKQYDVIGDTMNTGARLCSAAGRGEILIGQGTFDSIVEKTQIDDAAWELEIGMVKLGSTTRALDTHRIIFEETEPLSLKGKSAGFRTFRVLSVSKSGAASTEPAAASG
jgi:adenylate cyclase